MYYHTLANQTKNRRDLIAVNQFSYETQRSWFWFPLFSFFESEIDSKIPNEFQWPLTMCDLKDYYNELKGYCHILLSKINKDVPKETTKNMSKKKMKTK